MKSLPRSDILTGILLSLAVITATWCLSQPLAFLNSAWDVWFDTDTPRVVKSMTSRHSEHHCRSNVHPLFPLLTSPVTVVSKAIPSHTDLWVRMWVVFLAGAWSISLFAALRIFGHTRIESTLFTSIGAMTSGAIIHLPIPESFILGSISILLTIISFSACKQGYLSPIWLWIAACFSLTVTTTNFMAGVFALLLFHGLKKGSQQILCAIGIIAILSAIQHFIFPDSQSFLIIKGEIHNVKSGQASTPVEKTQAFFCHTIVFPKLQIRETEIGPILSVQRSRIGSAGWLNIAATMIWCALFAWGLAGSFIRARFDSSMRLVLLVLFGQFVLHLAYGIETVLYAVHFSPLLVLVSATCTRGKQQRIALLCGFVLFILLAITGIQSYEEAVRIGKSIVRPSHSMVGSHGPLYVNGK